MAYTLHTNGANTPPGIIPSGTLASLSDLPLLAVSGSTMTVVVISQVT